MKAVALYARVSSEQQAQQATVESQVAELRLRIEQDGHRLGPTDVFVDEGYSGAVLIRPALERLRDRVAEGGFDIVYVHSPDRLARRYAYQVLLLDELARHGTSVAFIHGPQGDTAEDQLLVQMQGMIAEYERAKILERCRRGKLHRARGGAVSPLSGAPYGYRYVRKTDAEPARYEVLLPEAKVVRDIFSWLVHEQKSIGEIVRQLNGQKVPTRKGVSRWDRSTVWAMLRNPAYMGRAAFGKTESIAPSKLLRPIRGRGAIPKKWKTGRLDKPSPEWISIDVPALISADVFAAAKEQLERNKRLSQRSLRGRRYLLQGLTVCAKCGYAYYGKTVSRASAKGKDQWGYYRCVGTDNYRFAGGRICNNAQLRVDQLDDYVWASVAEFLKNPERLHDEWSHRGETGCRSSEMERQRDEASRSLAAQEKGIQRLLDAYEAGALDLDELKQRSDRARARIERARLELNEAEKKLSEIVEIHAVVRHLEAFSDQVCQRLEDATWEERRQIIRALVARVEIDADGATVVYRVPIVPVSRGSSSSGGNGVDESLHLRGRSAQPVAQQRLAR